MVEPEGVGSRGCRRVEIVEVGAGTVGRVVRPDCSTSPSCFALSWTTKPVLRKSTMLGCSSGNLCIRPVSAAFPSRGLEKRTWVDGSW